MSKRFWLLTLSGWAACATGAVVFSIIDPFLALLCLFAACFCPFLSGPENNELKGK